ncbi:MAG: MarR family transcriptional regulator [Actinobacteria bacterium]|nr:MarR family transcriptional regulator [Actinomycetota bacterium]
MPGRCLDVKNLADDNVSVPPSPRQDRIDSWLAEHAAELPNIDLTVEGVVDRLFSLRRHLQRSMDATLAGLGLTWEDFKVLSTLGISPSRRRSAGELARKLEITSGSMTNRIDRLEAAGLVRRVPNPDDRRGVLVELTSEGLAAWQRSVEVQAGREQEIATAALERDELEQLNGYLRRLMLVFEDAGGEADAADA